jgi:AcrR family transcriptional regulator
MPPAKTTRTSRTSSTARPSPAPAKADARRRQSRGGARRQQILDAAVALFAAKGYRSTGLAELADTVGMTHPGLLYYFGTKERLLLEVVAERERIEAEMRQDLDPTTLSLDTLTEIARQNVENAMLTRLYVVLAAESLDEDDPLHDFFVRRYDGARRRTERLLQHGMAAGELRDDVDATQLSQEILAMLMGLELQWLMDPERFDLVTTMEAYVESLRTRLTPPSRSAGKHEPNPSTKQAPPARPPRTTRRTSAPSDRKDPR